MNKRPHETGTNNPIDFPRTYSRQSVIKRAFGRVVAETLYIVGDLISYPMLQFNIAWLYPIYNYLMVSSTKIQDWSGASGPW